MGFLGGDGTKSSKPPVYTSLQLQTSTQALPIPIFWGTQKVVGNIIDIFNFQGKSSKKGGGGKGGKGSEIYSASVVIALCEGAANGYTINISRMWTGTSQTGIESFGGFLTPGTADQGVWSDAAAVGHNVAYAYTCYYANSDISLGESATLPNLEFELVGTFQGYNTNHALGGAQDANFGDIIPDFLTNPRYALNMDPALLRNFNDGGGLASTTSLLVYHYCVGIFASPLLKDAQQVSTTLERWGSIGNFWTFWSGTDLRCVPLGGSNLSAVGPDGLMVNYIPPVTPIYDLGPDDFQVSDKTEKASDPPVKVTRKDPADSFNQVQLNASIRTTNNGVANSPAYQDTPFRWQDDSSIFQNNTAACSNISSNEICTNYGAAAAVSLIGQRAKYINNDYAFNLLQNFILLLPGDIVTLTDPNIGLVKFPVRIKTVSEDSKNKLSFLAEEFAYAVGDANIQEFEGSGSVGPWNTLDPPSSINPPTFIVPDLSLTGGVPEVWIVLSGGENVGGAGVYVSFDTIQYAPLGFWSLPSLQGTLTADLPSASGTDTVNTLAIDLTECLGVMPATATEADADALRTLCLVGDELLAYGAVMPTGAYTSDLTYLVRGAYGSTTADHPVGTAFARVDPTKVFRYTLPAGAVGEPLDFKFPTVNSFGNSAQTLDECAVYSFTPPAYGVPAITSAVNQYNADGSYAGLLVEWTAPTGGAPTSYTIRWSDDDGMTGAQEGYASAPGGAVQALIPAGQVLANPGGYGETSMQAVFGPTPSAWTSPFTVTGAAPFPSLLSALSGSALAAAARVTWTPPSGTAPTFYRVFYWQGTPGVMGYTIAHEDIAAPASQATINGLSSGTAYTFSVVTYNANGTAETFAASPSFQPISSAQATVTPS